MYLVGWKGMSDYLKISTRHLQRWHYSYCRIPFVKDGPSQNNRVRITPSILEEWYRRVQKLKALQPVAPPRVPVANKST